MTTKIGQLAQELARTNPWWSDPNWQYLDPDLRGSTSRGMVYESHVLAGLEPGCLYILKGPRRAGKTVAVKQQILNLVSSGTPPTSIVRIAADGMDAKDIRTVVQRTALPLAPEGQNRYWFIDEVSAVTGKWDEQIKWLRDNDLGFHDSTVVLTGSNAASLTAGAGTLAGRRGEKPNLDRILLPLGFRTFAQLASRGSLPNAPELAVSTLRTPEARASYHNLIPWLDQLVELWEMYILYGGFPVSVAAAVQRAPIPDAFVDDLFNVVSADTFKASRLSAHTEMSLLDRLWLSMSSPANLVNIGVDVGISQDTVTRHVGYLRDALLLWHCPQKDENQWTPRLRAQDKLYAIDPLIARLPHLRNSGRPDIDPTVLTEMQVGMAVNRRVRVQTVRITNDQFLFYFKTPTRKEIDFVSEVFAGVALEVKYVEDGQWNSEAATVNASNWHGLLVTRNVLDTKADSAWAVPAGILCYLMDT